MSVTGRFIGAYEMTLAADAHAEDLQLRVHYSIPKRRRRW